MATYFRYDGSIRSTVGEAISGASLAVLTQPADTDTQPGSPLAVLFAAADTNAPAISAASWLAGQITLTLASIPTDLVVDSYIRVSASNPAGYNGVFQVLEINGLQVVVAQDTNPGVYVGSATLQTSALPNPFLSDGLGNFDFYALPGIYTLQIYGVPSLPDNQLVFADQNVVAGAANGSVTSVSLALPAEFNVTGSPGSTVVALGATFADVAANRVLAGPASGPAATPHFRALVAADFPTSGTVTSVGVAAHVPASILTVNVTNTPILTSGVIDIAIALQPQAANLVWAGPSSGGSDFPTFRALVEADIPALPASKITTGLLALARGGTGVDLSATGGATNVLAQAAGGVISSRVLIAADIPNIAQAQVTGLAAALALKAPLAGPSFTGTVNIALAGVQIFANNAAALGGGLVAGDLYRSGADPDVLAIVH